MQPCATRVSGLTNKSPIVSVANHSQSWGSTLDQPEDIENGGNEKKTSSFPKEENEPKFEHAPGELEQHESEEPAPAEKASSEEQPGEQGNNLRVEFWPNVNNLEFIVS